MKPNKIKITYINKKCIRRIINTTAMTLCFYLATTIPGNIIRDNDNFQEYNIDTNDYIADIFPQEEFDNIDYQNIDEESVMLIYDIYDNKNLSSKEKKAIYNLYPLWTDVDNFDVKNACNNISKLDIKYITRPEIYAEKIHGTYNYKKNEIAIYEEEETVSESTLSHEIIHALFTNENTKKLPAWFREGMTQLLTKEYTSEEPYIEKSTYPFEVTMVKLLCEMVTPDKVIEAYISGNIDIIYQEFDKMYKKDIIDKFKRNTKSVFESFENGEKIKAEDYNNMIIFINYYFAPNEYTSNIDTELIDYYKNILSLLNSSNPYQSYNDFINSNEGFSKPYFSEELIEKYKNSSISFTKEKIKYKDGSSIINRMQNEYENPKKSIK